MGVILPRDDNREPIQGVGVEGTPLAVTYDATISSSTEITLNAATTFIVVTANTKPVFMNWGTADASSTVWSHLLPADSVTVFKVPPSTTAVNFLEQAATATLGVAEY